jgi:hypothetical protein
MDSITIIALGQHDYPFGTYADDEAHAWRDLTGQGYTRMQIQNALVRELQRLDVTAWNEYQTAIERYNAGETSYDATVQAQEKTYRVRERLSLCTQELRRQQRAAYAKQRKENDDYARFESFMERFGD